MKTLPEQNKTKQHAPASWEKQHAPPSWEKQLTRKPGDLLRSVAYDTILVPPSGNVPKLYSARPSQTYDMYVQSLSLGHGYASRENGTTNSAQACARTVG